MCPSCGDARSKIVKRDSDENGLTLRLRRCAGCGFDFPTIEAPITDDSVTFYTLAARRRDYERYWKRDRRRRGPRQIENRGRWLRKKPFVMVSTKIGWRE